MAKYKTYQRNHVILPTQEKALDSFLNSTFAGHKHKLKNACNSNSEDALTWSCFDVIRNQSHAKIQIAVDEIIEDAFEMDPGISFNAKDTKIDIGKRFDGPTINEGTEVDASLEDSNHVLFIEAKLYSSMSLADPPSKPHNQLARKLRIGVDYASSMNKKFSFIVLDIAPVDQMYSHKSKKMAMDGTSSYKDKWKTAWWFKYYKNGRNGGLKPLTEILIGVNQNGNPITEVSHRMGWLTWGNLFKTTMRSLL